MEKGKKKMEKFQNRRRSSKFRSPYSFRHTKDLGAELLALLFLVYICIFFFFFVRWSLSQAYLSARDDNRSFRDTR